MHVDLPNAPLTAPPPGMSIPFTDLVAGIPTLVAYEALLKSPAYGELEMRSDRFRATHRATLARYARRWVADPLRQWSRRWEYPYVLDRLARGAAPYRRVLDAGSGLTFFPFTLIEAGVAARVDCCDYDPMVEESFARYPAALREHVGFRLGKLQELPWEDGAFDALYSVSVLEHTDNYGSVLDEFARVLAPGGRLVLTFDISLDGTTDVSPARAQELLDDLDARFERIEPSRGEALAAMLARPGLLTTGYARRTRPESVPWRRTWRSDLALLARLRMPRSQFHDLAVLCGTWTRRPTAGPAS